jgi:hypothetical protein
MGFLAGENVVLSEANNLEQFYRTTLATQIDSDPIDVAVLVAGNDVLYHAVPFNKDLILSSDQNQYRLSYSQLLGPKNMNIQFTTSFAMSRDVRPMNMGNDKPGYNYAKVFEYFPKDETSGDDAEEASAPVPEYLQAGVKFMASSPRMKTIVLNSINEPATLYLYKFFWAGDRKVQNAWSKWTFADCMAIYWAGFSGDYLYILLNRSDGVYLERMRVAENVTRKEISTRHLVDRQANKSKLTLSYDPEDGPLGVTTITLPWSTTETPEIIASWFDDDPESQVLDLRHLVEKVDGDTVKVTGDLTTADVVTAGIPYTFLYRFTTPYLRQQKGSGEVVVLDGLRLQLRYMTIEYTDTAYFTTVLKYPGRDDVTTTFDGKITGDASFIMGTTPFVTGKFRVPLVGNNKDCTLEIQNDAPYNCSFGSAEWSCIFSPRAKMRM